MVGGKGGLPKPVAETGFPEGLTVSCIVSKSQDAFNILFNCQDFSLFLNMSVTQRSLGHDLPRYPAQDPVNHKKFKFPRRDIRLGFLVI